MDVHAPEVYSTIFREAEEEIRRRRQQGRTEEDEDRADPGTYLRAAEAMIRHARLLRTRGTGIFSPAPADWPFGPGTWTPPITAEEACRKALAFIALEMAAGCREREKYPLDPTI